MSEPAKRVGRIMLSGCVRRYHTLGDTISQTVGEHAWGVATLISLLHPDPSARLLKAALLHDGPGMPAGAAPSKVKRGRERAQSPPSRRRRGRSNAFTASRSKALGSNSSPSHSPISS